MKAEQAREFFAHRSQQRMGLDPAQLHDNGFEYWADGPVCLVFHRAPWPDVWMVHIGVKPEAWGRTKGHVLTILSRFWAERRPRRIVAWIEDENRAALSLARRCGFETDGAFPGVIMMGWQQWQSAQH